MGKRVEIHRTSRADLNGTRGVTTDLHFDGTHAEPASTTRYTVKLDSGESFKLKPVNVRAERASAGPSGAKAKQGKGKKGRGGAGK